MTTDDHAGLEHLDALKPLLREALQPLADSIERPPLTFDYHSSGRAQDGTLQMMFVDATDRIWVATVPADGSTPTFCRVN